MKTITCVCLVALLSGFSWGQQANSLRRDTHQPISDDGMVTTVSPEAEILRDHSATETVGDEEATAPYDPYFPDVQLNPLPIPEWKPPKGVPVPDNQIVIYDLETNTETKIEMEYEDSHLRENRMRGTGVPLAGDPEIRISSPAKGWSDLELVNDPEQFPWRVNCRIAITFNGRGYQGSAVLIDAKHVLTAGHCVYSHDQGGWADDVFVSAAYENGTNWYGPARAVRLYSWTAWTGNEDYNHDVAIIELDRPVGGLTGWHGYCYIGDGSFFKNNVFYIPGYPGQAPYNGQYMYYWYGSFDIVESYRLGFLRKAYGGQSGSGAYHIQNGHRYVDGVLSHGVPVWLFWASYVCRITSNKFYGIEKVISDNTPSRFDLVALDVDLSPSSITAGEPLTYFSYCVHNYSSAGWAGTGLVNVYLSENDYISDKDILLQTRRFSYQFGAKSTVRFVASSDLPTVPDSIATGDYYIGVILQVSDHNTGNNDTYGWDAAAIHVDCAIPDVPTGVTASDGGYGEITVSWNAVGNESGYRVFRDGRVIGSTAAEETTYVDRACQPYVTYEYAVCAYNQCGAGDLSRADSGYCRPTVATVWPGDLDNNGVAEAADILPLVRHWMEQGPARDAIDYRWSPHQVQIWDVPSATYADADGSGRVGIEDFFPICLNWANTHTGALCGVGGNEKSSEGLASDVLRVIYDQVRDSRTGPQYEIKRFIEGLLGISRPAATMMYQNYPNPFDFSTVIRYEIPVAACVQISIYNMLGQRAKVLVNGVHEAGLYEVTWDGVDGQGQQVSPGVYFYRLDTSDYSCTKRMTLIR